MAPAMSSQESRPPYTHSTSAASSRARAARPPPPISIRRSTFLRNRWYSRALSVWIGVAPAGAS